MKELYRFLLLNSFNKTIAETDLVSRQRFRLFKIVTAISFFVYLAFIMQIWVVDPNNKPVLYIMSGLFIVVFLNYFALPIHKKAKLTYTVMLLLWFSLIHIDTYYSGGIKNSANFYLADVVLAAYMLMGVKGGVWATVLSAMHLIYFYLISRYTGWISYSFMGGNPNLMYLYYFISTTTSVLILTMQASYIERSKNEIIQTINSGKDTLAFKNMELLASEAAIVLKNRELERKNKELEQFAFVASHDLQEPIRTSSAFAELLQRQYKGKLDERADKYLFFIIYSSQRMNTLVKELLEYSRIGCEEKTVLIDCNEVMNVVMTDLNKSILESDAIISYDDLPVINGYYVGIKQLFQNLVSNAIKFRAYNTTPRVKISCEQQGPYWHFWITDNGIGISRAYFEKIFLIFQRLHTRTEYEGTGIGLSHCKKIVELHNGKIWLESIPSMGSTFHFTIALQYQP